ncbi:migration and invasion-inhibitory protein isoform X2 [Suricata suricatta]|uniref:Migration and invasion inhibitory protein n=1 Tax=Suricata suricatta TaxID=37032 RepID=A0A673U1Z7_SURSU|nr:migration and invasion-inhibitory protein isoform X2 [Suricata suricatta]
MLTPGMLETKDWVQLRQLNLVLLRQLWVGQDAVRRSVAKAASGSTRDSSSSCDSQTPSSQESSSMALRASRLEDTHQGDPRDMSWPGGASSGGTSLPPATYRPRPCSAPLLAVSDPDDSELSGELDSPGPQETQAQRSILDQQSRVSKPRVTFSEEFPMPDGSWRFRPYLGYDWIAGSLDNASPVTSKPEAFFSKLQDFREANKEECVHSDPEPQFLGVPESSREERDHECVYCYRVNRRLFLVPSDPGTPCRLCRTPRDQRGPETLAEPAQVRVSVPMSVLDPPHRHRIHRRKSFDASDTLALPRHCLMGWDILPPKPEKSSAPKSLDLWSYVASEPQYRKLSAASPSHPAQPTRVPSSTPFWSELQPRAPRLKP